MCSIVVNIANRHSMIMRFQKIFDQPRFKEERAYDVFAKLDNCVRKKYSTGN